MKSLFFRAAIICILPIIASAEDAPMAHGHGDQIFHAFTLQTDVGRSRATNVSSWDFDGWVGGDTDKIWLKSEGERSGSRTEQAEFWAMGSHAISTFWDVQAGLRWDAQPHAHTYAVLGFDGLTPYFLETEAHLFLRDDGGLSARIREEYEVLLTNRLITQPYIEANLNATPDGAEELGAGLTQMQFGLQTRYEITRGFAPYIDLKYEQKYGRTADYANHDREHGDAASVHLGIRWMF
jgi:copper resistance protein B